MEPAAEGEALALLARHGVRVDGRCTTKALPSLAHDIAIVRCGDEGFVVKRARDARGRRDIATEGRVLEAVANRPELGDLRSIVPVLVARSEEDGLIATRLLSPSARLEAFALDDPADFDQHARAAGHLLGRVHRILAEAWRAAPWAGLPEKEPTIWHSDLARQELGDAALATQSRSWWTAPRGLVHGDAVYDNLLVVDDETEPMRLVDWEYLSVGDPAWDVANLVADGWRLALTRAASTGTIDTEAPRRWARVLLDGHRDASGIDLSDRARIYLPSCFLVVALKTGDRPDLAAHALAAARQARSGCDI